MQTSTPPILKGKVVRPAMLELGVADAAQLAKTKTFYEALLGETNYPYRLTTDIALLCVATADGSTQTIIYWEIPGKTIEKLQEVYDDLIENNGCGGLHPPHKPPRLSLLPADIAICTLADAAGNVLGLVTNPPYPLE